MKRHAQRSDGPRRTTFPVAAPAAGVRPRQRLCNLTPRSRKLLPFFRTSALLFFTAFLIPSADAHAPQLARPDETRQAQERLTVHVVDGVTQVPLAGVQLQFSGRIDGQILNQTLLTDIDGLAQFAWPAGANVQYLRMTARKRRFVPVHYSWSSDQREIEIPQRVELILDPGQPIGGVVRDEAGQPIADALVILRLPVTWPRQPGYVFRIAELTTDAEGRWQYDAAPEDVGNLRISAQHPDYIGGSIGRPGLNLDNVIVLKQGTTVTGQVFDGEGKPVPWAQVQLGLSRFGSGEPSVQTDQEGKFELKNCQEGPSAVTVQADGFSPQFVRLTVGPKNELLTFRLEPGHALRGRVVDASGAPIAGALIAPDTWRGLRTLGNRMTTDAEGRFEWTSAPPDGVQYDILKQGYMSLRDHVLIAREQEHVITLYPELKITGRVTDAATGEPVTNFRVRRGQIQTETDRTYWYPDEGAFFTGGTYSLSFDEPRFAWLLRVEAEGYSPAASRQFKSTEGRVTFDFALQRGSGPWGIVVLPNGAPAKGAKVGLATADRSMWGWIEGGHFSREDRGNIVTADDEGRFSFLPQPEDVPFMIVALHEAGFAEVTREELEDLALVKLTPWGRLEGRVLVGQEPDANREITFNPRRQSGSPERDALAGRLWDGNYRTTTDAHGRFEFNRVPPGSGTVSRVVVTRRTGGSTHTPGWQTPVEIRPGETTEVAIGGAGRAVVGRVVTDRPPDEPVSWPMNPPASLEPSTRERGAPYPRYLGAFDDDGRFTIPDVTAGQYRLTVDVSGPRNASGPWSIPIARAELNVTVPEMPGGRSDEPLDLGTVTANLYPVLEPGALTPDFVVAGLDDKTLRLSDFSGKLVLLNFASTSARQDLTELTALAQLHEQFGKDPNFVIVTIWCGTNADAARRLVEANELAWQHGTVRSTRSRAPQDYLIRNLPATFLINASGRVISRNAKIDELQRSIESLLSLGELFEMNRDERPPRYPVTHFEPAGDATPLASPPAVVVLDDSDRRVQQGQPGDDRLRLLTADGTELWSLGGFSNVQSTGARHAVAIDDARKRIYVCENFAKRLTALTFHGQKLWQIDQVEADAVALDGKTGNVWVTGGPMLNEGETVVFTPEGRELTAFPLRGVDLAYDPHDDAFWLVGYEILKLSREGEVLFRRRLEGWSCPSVSVNPTDGSVWIVERSHPDVPTSKNRLWLLSGDGTVRRDVDLGEQGAFVVECSPQDSAAWIAGYGVGLRRVAPDGQIGEPLPIMARNVAIRGGDIWVTTEEAVLRLDAAGNELARSPFAAPSQQAWIASF